MRDKEKCGTYMYLRKKKKKKYLNSCVFLLLPKVYHFMAELCIRQISRLRSDQGKPRARPYDSTRFQMSDQSFAHNSNGLIFYLNEW